MKVIDVTITGISPLLMHAFTDEDQMSATSGQRTSSAARGRETPEQIAEGHLYRSADDETIIVPQPMLFSAIVAAGKFFKNGKSKITTMRTSLIPGCVFFDETEFPLEHDGWSVDTRAVRIPSTGGRIQRHRPVFHQWSCSFTVRLDTSEMSEGLFRDLVDSAGRKIGIGDFRPECKGPFGRFVVTKWASADEPETAKIAAE